MASRIGNDLRQRSAEPFITSLETNIPVPVEPPVHSIAATYQWLSYQLENLRIIVDIQCSKYHNKEKETSVALAA